MNEAGHSLSDDMNERVTRAFRYAQVGRCVSSVTHDINNYLGAIMAYAELCGMDAQISDDSKRMLGEMLKAVRKCADLVGNLTDVARRERPDIRLLEPQQLTQRVLDIRGYDLRTASVRVTTQYQPNLPFLAVNLPRVQQAFMYLVANTLEAMDSADHKALKIAVEDEGGEVVFSFKDSAKAVPEPIRQKMFDPFFTTKGPDHLGLGLTFARATFEDHGGSLTYDPESGFVARIARENKYSGGG